MRIDREAVLLLGGRRSLLLQLAHPLVAQGVADHSNFRNDRIGRLLRTVDLSLTMVFGDEQASMQAVNQINAVHRSVHGFMPEAVGRYPAGTPYTAEDPGLLLWVYATLVESAITSYSRFVSPLSEAERSAYYHGSIETATRFGIPPKLIPEDYQTFLHYFQNMIDGDELAVGTAGREAADAILYPSVRAIPKRFLDPLNLITIGTLPKRIRDLYGLRWNLARAAALRALTAAAPTFVRMLPPRLRFVPHARGAEKNLTAGGHG